MPRAMRIVSLCPSLTELVVDLGLERDLVGVTSWCIHPAAVVELKTKVGGTKDPDIERIVGLQPDVVLMNEEENRIEDLQALQQRGIACHSSFPRDCAGTATMVREIGARLDAAPRAEEIARDIETRAARVRRDALGRPPVSFAYLVWRKPWIAVNGDTFAHSLLAQAGGHNVFSARAERYPRVELEQLAAAAPRAVFLCTEPFAFLERHADELARETCLPRGSFVIADGELLSWHGSRTPRGIDYAEGLIQAARRACAG